MIRSVILILFTLFTLPQMYAQRVSSWQRVEDEKYNISFALPNKPEKISRFSGKIPVVVYQTKTSMAVMGIVCSGFEQGGIPINGETVNKLYEEMKAGSLEVETALLKKESTVPFNDLLVKEIEYTVVSNRQEMTYFKRFIFRDGIAYQITIGGRTRHRALLEEMKTTLFNSLNFTK